MFQANCVHHQILACPDNINIKPVQYLAAAKKHTVLLQNCTLAWANLQNKNN